MKISVLAVGRLKERHFREAADEYLKRLGPYATVEMNEVADRDVSRDETRALAEEGAALLRAIPAGAYVVALDISGTQRSSERFAEWLEEGMVSGRSHVAFVLGGATGLAPEVLERANERMSLGPMTLPHQMARVVVLEQVYRAFRIIRGEPYHH
ncbi:MAG: 23S rRNA (pseudouridine(1915)-N(3))-methyltransferase RlmH [Actinobacteria bacterium HGW-Actinobacteria-10]|nr:MAG: 23S rRNA (pseudouridine(1915)-N(3))-methyltransferase RlmH [Actinobacteria bacterium HGW-Actinobacteria-10]